MMNQRNKAIGDSQDGLKDGEEWVTVTDFETGQPKRIKKVKRL